MVVWKTCPVGEGDVTPAAIDGDNLRAFDEGDVELLQKLSRAKMKASFVDRPEKKRFRQGRALIGKLHLLADQRDPAFKAAFAQRDRGRERASRMGSADPRDVREGMDPESAGRLVLPGRERRMEEEMIRI